MHNLVQVLFFSTMITKVDKSNNLSLDSETATHIQLQTWDRNTPLIFFNSLFSIHDQLLITLESGEIEILEWESTLPYRKSISLSDISFALDLHISGKIFKCLLSEKVYKSRPFLRSKYNYVLHNCVYFPKFQSPIG